MKIRFIRQTILSILGLVLVFNVTDYMLLTYMPSYLSVTMGYAESKGLLLGEPASPEVQKQVLAIVQQDPAVQQANGILSVHIGPEEIVAGLSIEFEDHLTAPDIEACVERLEARLKREMPQISRLFVKPQATGIWEQRRKAIAEASGER